MAAPSERSQNHRPSAEHNLFEWLHKHSLDHYYINFIQSELTDLNAVARIQLPNEELYDELEIVLPGHKKRLERAVASLHQERIGHVPTEIPVTQGWWGKPECLPQAKFDFLCVSANLCASKQPENKVSIDFMVDSGSDVSTVQEKTLENLNLELIGPVYSCGIHGGNYTNLYKAQLEVGDVKLDIEVLASNYNSLGSRIVRHFRHVIDGKRHIWLKGNYKDPLPAILPTLSSAKSLSGACTTLTNSAETQPSIAPPSPSSTSVSSASSSSSSEIISLSSFTDKKKTKNENYQLQTAITQSQYKPGSQLSSKRVAFEPVDNSGIAPNCPAFYQSECSIQQSTSSSNFIPPLSTHDQDNITSSTASNVHQCENSFKSINVRCEPSSCSSSQSIRSVVCHQEEVTRYKKEENNELSGFDENQSRQLQINSVDFKSAGHKRQNLSSLDDIATSKKIPKIDNNDSGIIHPTFKDTDDDIDNINAFVVKHIHHSNNSQHGTCHSGSHELNQQLPSLMKRENIAHGGIGNINSSNGKDVPEEVVHVLSCSDDEEEPHLQDDERYNQSPEIMGQNSNFMPGVGTCVIIPVDDLEENVII